MAKKLTLSELNKAHKSLNERKLVHLKDGQFTIELATHFKNTAIQRLILDYQDILNELKKQNLTTEVIKDLMLIFNMLILKHFSSLPLQNTNVSQLLSACEKLIDLDLFGEIFSYFPEGELEKLRVKVSEVSKSIPQISQAMGDLFASGIINETMTDGEQVEKTV